MPPPPLPFELRLVIALCALALALLLAVAWYEQSTRLPASQRAFVAELLYYNIYPGVLPIGTAANPADDPSRLEPVRSPSEPFPWAQRYLEGNLAVIDAKV